MLWFKITKLFWKQNKKMFLSCNWKLSWEEFFITMYIMLDTNQAGKMEKWIYPCDLPKPQLNHNTSSSHTLACDLHIYVYVAPYTLYTTPFPIFWFRTPMNIDFFLKLSLFSKSLSFSITKKVVKVANVQTIILKIYVK